MGLVVITLQTDPESPDELDFKLLAEPPLAAEGEQPSLAHAYAVDIIELVIAAAERVTNERGEEVKSGERDAD